MEIRMTGLDYKKSELSIREKFAAGHEKAKNIIKTFTSLEYIKGCVIISTCNRTEIYISIQESHEFNISGFLCRVLGLEPSQYAPHFTERNEKETFSHLCNVAAGVDSQIIGDDQIITQVREAVELSRAAGFTDSYIETAFKTAIKAAKEIKTKITVRPERTASAPYKAVEKIKSICPIKGKKAVVIGNGQMGRLASELLISESVQVTITLREYKKGVVYVPCGAGTIGYSSRYEALENAYLVISATTSPHYTLHYEEFIKLKSKPGIIIDLAVPRDVEPGIGALPDIKLFTIDDLGDEGSSISDEKILLANKIIENNMQNYCKWREYKENKNENLCSRHRAGRY